MNFDKTYRNLRNELSATEFPRPNTNSTSSRIDSVCEIPGVRRASQQPMPSEPGRQPAQPQDTDLPETSTILAVAECLSAVPQSVDDIAEDCNITPQTVCACLSLLKSALRITLKVSYINYRPAFSIPDADDLHLVQWLCLRNDPGYSPDDLTPTEDTPYDD